MSAHLNSLAEREGRLGEVLAALIEAREGGEALDRAAWLARHPDFAAELNEFFASEDRLRSVAAPLRAAVQADTPAPGVTSAEGKGAPPGPAPAVPPCPVGDYELLEEVGRGGMGIVYKARQKGANRVVALKLLRADPLGEEEQARRLRNEAEIVAQLDHPHIVPLYEVGEHAGRVFFSMKFVEGGSLAEHLPRYREDPRAAARLVADVARAVHHAHQRGVLHRDLKPSNILLDGEGRPFVSDFGLARRVEGDSSLTQSGVLVGTPSYMAPEQTTGRRGAVTTATDVYGLGAVLYALLTGRPPFRGDTMLDTLEQVKSREPEPPGRDNRRVGRDLETVCLKCLRKEPQQRYGSAEALAEDLERWLKGEPIHARTIGTTARVWHWCRRNPLAAWLTAAMLTALLLTVGVLAVCTWLIWQEKEETKAALGKADAKSRWARRAVNDMYTRVAVDWLAHEPQLTDVQRQFLRNALEFYKELAGEGGSDPEQRLETGQAYGRIGDIAWVFPGQEDGEAALRLALAIFERLAGEFPEEKKYRQELASTERKLGRFLELNDRFPEAEELLSRSLSRLAPLAKDSPDDADARESRAACLTKLANLWRRMGRPREADDASLRVLEILEDLTARFPDLVRYQESLADACKDRAVLLMEEDRLEEAAQAYRKAVAVHEKLLAGPTSAHRARWGLSGSYSGLAYILADLGHLAEAEKAADQGLRLRKQVDADHPADPRVRHTLALSYSYHGRMLTLLGRPRDAERAYQQAVELERQQVKLYPAIPGRRQELALMLGYLAWLHACGPATVRDPAKALEEAREALELAPGHGPYLTTLLGAVTYRLGDGERAAALLPSADETSQGRTQPARAWVIISSVLKRDADARERMARPMGHFFLAMNHWKRREKDIARDCYQQALRQMSVLRITARLPREELEATRAEAAALLELAP